LGFREEIAEEQQLKRLKAYLDEEIKMAKYENSSATTLKAIRDKINVRDYDEPAIGHFRE